MSIEAMTLVLHHSRASGTDKLVLLGIANHAGAGGSWPSIGTLATYANVDESSARRAVRRLEKLGELATERQAGGRADTPHHQRTNLYRVLVECPPTCDRTAQHRVRPLPTAPADLWRDPPASAPGGGVHVRSGVASTPGGPLAPTPAEPPLEPTMKAPLSPVPTARATDVVVVASGTHCPTGQPWAADGTCCGRAHEHQKAGVA